MTSQPPIYHGYRFPPQIISHAPFSSTLSARLSEVYRARDTRLDRDVTTQSAVCVRLPGCRASFRFLDATTS